jgi:hypothetical protein
VPLQRNEDFRLQAAGGGQFGARVEDEGGNESANEIALRATSTGEQIRKAEMAQGSEDSGDMAMRRERRIWRA